MTKAKTSRPVVPPSFFAKLLLPFAIPILVTFALVLTVGESWPRNMAPGSGLKLWGLCAAAVTTVLVWRFATSGIADLRVHKVAAVICGVVGLMGWPVWSVGVLPSINGISLASEETAPMTLERMEVTTVSRSSDLNHWAWLRPEAADSPLDGGRYFIPEATYDDWNSQPPRSVTVISARGLLGARVVTGFGRGRLEE
jgi:hypothetical protein